MKANEQYFPVVLFIMLYKVILTSESVDELLKCDHSIESYWAVLSCGAVYYAVQGDSNFWVCGWTPKVWPFKWKLSSSTFRTVFLFVTDLVVLQTDNRGGMNVLDIGQITEHRNLNCQICDLPFYNNDSINHSTLRISSNTLAGNLMCRSAVNTMLLGSWIFWERKRLFSRKKATSKKLPF